MTRPLGHVCERAGGVGETKLSCCHSGRMLDEEMPFKAGLRAAPHEQDITMLPHKVRDIVLLSFSWRRAYAVALGS